MADEPARPSLRHANAGNDKAPDGGSKNNGSTATSTGISAPAGHAFRRAKTVADIHPAAARRSTSSRRLSSDSSFEAPSPMLRRSSNFSEYSLNEARSILNPHGKAAAATHTGADQSDDSSPLAGLSLAFALLPAVAGALFKNGSAVVTDILLLGLAGVFLHWSVTQPWHWYHSAQQVRIDHEQNSADVIERDYSDEEDFEDGASHLDDVPEDESPQAKEPEKKQPAAPTSQQQSALTELYLHEVMALLSCFSLPLIAAFILHMIRAQLSRPSEGLVSNYNLTIFILVSEVRVLSHVIKLVQARTMHLQRVVHSNPYGTLATTNSLRINAILERLDAIESGQPSGRGRGMGAGTTTFLAEDDEDDEDESAKAAQEAVLTKDVRNAIQPELDALNRAVRRYEKKSTLLQSHVDAHFASMDARVEDAIALAAVAAKNSSQSGLLARGFEALLAVVLFPFNAVLSLLLLPVTWVLSLTGGKSKQKKSAAGGASNGSIRNGSAKPYLRASRASKPSGPPRYNGDKMPSRLARK